MSSLSNLARTVAATMCGAFTLLRSLTMWRCRLHVAAYRGVCVAAAMLVALNSASPQESGGPVAGKVCSIDHNKGFVRQASPLLRITPTFVGKPDADASAAEIKNHLIYAHILATIASTELSKSSSWQCIFGSSINASLDFHFELFGAGTVVHDECSLSRCAGLLSDLLQSAVISRLSFSNAIDVIVDDFRFWDAAEIATPGRSARRSALEAFRHIYPAGSRERIYVDISADDFREVAFDEFSTWFGHQQSRLISALNGNKALTLPLVAAPEAEDVHCADNPDVRVEELNIDRHGWGQRSIIMIMSGFKSDGLAGIDNAVLRAFCSRGESHGLLTTSPWSDMAGRVSCDRRRVSHRNRWLVLYSKQSPAQTGAEMARFAQGIAKALMEDRCVDPQLRIVVVNFLQQK